MPELKNDRFLRALLRSAAGRFFFVTQWLEWTFAYRVATMTSFFGSLAVRAAGM